MQAHLHPQQCRYQCTQLGSLANSCYARHPVVCRSRRNQVAPRAQHKLPDGKRPAANNNSTTQATAAGALAALLILSPPGSTLAAAAASLTTCSTRASCDAHFTAVPGASSRLSIDSYQAPSLTQGSSTAGQLVAEIPWPKAPSTPTPPTPPNSPLPTPNMPNPPFIPNIPPPTMPPQLLPPHAWSQPPPYRLLPKAPTNASDQNMPTGLLFDGPGFGSDSDVSLLGLFHHQQASQERWQQALLQNAFSQGGASLVSMQEPPSLPLPGDVPLPLYRDNYFTHDFTLRTNRFQFNGFSTRNPFHSSSKPLFGSRNVLGQRHAMLAVHATADTSESPIPAVSKVTVTVPDSSGGSATRPTLSGFESNIVSPSASNAASAQQKPSGGGNDWLQQLQQIPEAAQRDPGISDFLKASGRFFNALVQVAVPLLRILVQITAALIQVVAKVIAWGIDLAHKGAVNRVEQVRQQNIAKLGGQVQQKVVVGKVGKAAAVMVEAAEQQPLLT